MIDTNDHCLRNDNCPTVKGIQEKVGVKVVVGAREEVGGGEYKDREGGREEGERKVRGCE